MKINKLLIAVFLVFGLFSFSGCKESVEKKDVKEPSVYNDVLKSGVIRVGYIPYAPAVIKDPNTKALSGIFYDVLVEAAKNLDLKIEFVEELNWGTMVEAVKTNKVDIVCTAVYAKTQRGKFIDFTMPLYYSPLLAYTQFDNTSFDNSKKDFNSEDVSIATIDGEAVSILAKTDFPKASTVSLSQSSDVSQMLEEIASKKADVTFVEPIFANKYMNGNPNKIKAVVGIEPVRTYPVVMMTARDDGKFLAMINIALQDLHNSGFVEKTIQSYEPDNTAFYRLSKPFVRP